MPAPDAFSHYHLPGFQWSNVARVLIVPVSNESEFTRAGVEVRSALSAELQQLGMFEVVTPPPDYPTDLSEVIHRHGRFDEAAMLELADTFKADVILHVTITHYSPYPRPRLGLVVQAVSPFDAKVVASVDGLWDTTDLAMAEQMRHFYAAPRPGLLAIITNSAVPKDLGHASEVALDSPMLFQRFVCHQVAANLVTLNGLVFMPAVESNGVLPKPRPVKTAVLATDPRAAIRNR